MKIKKSISHFTGQEQHILYHIKKRLIKATQPILIWFLNSTASKILVRNPPTSVYNMEHFSFKCSLLLVLPENSPIVKDEGSLRDLQDSLAPVAEVDLIVYSVKQFAQAIQADNVLIHRFPQKAILLYDQGDTLKHIASSFSKRDQKKSGETE